MVYTRVLDSNTIVRCRANAQDYGHKYKVNILSENQNIET